MKEYVFGIDVGGTSVKIGFFSCEKGLLDKWEIPTARVEAGAHILPDIALSLKEYMERHRLLPENINGIGLDVPGPVLTDGSVSGCVNLGWGSFRVDLKMKEAWQKVWGTGQDICVSVINDANAAALGELLRGAGKGYDSLVMVTLGTGVGGGVIINGKALAGSVGAAGEIGHMRVNPLETDRCNCGRYGCLEQYASATGIVRLAKRHRSYLDESGSLVEGASVLMREENLSAKLVLDAAKEGDIPALAVFEEVCKYLGEALANVSAVVDTQLIVIGGGVSKAGEFLLEGIRKHYNEAVFYALKDKPIVLAELGNDGGIYGAAGLVM